MIEGYVRDWSTKKAYTSIVCSLKYRGISARENQYWVI